MKKIISVLMAVTLLLLQTSAFATHDGVKANNEKHSAYIAEALEKSMYTSDEIDKDNIYIVEKSNPKRVRNGGESPEIYVAMPILGTDDTAYGIFRNGEYYNERTKVMSMFYVQTIYNSQLDEYLRDNALEEADEIVRTEFWYDVPGMHIGRFPVSTYYVVKGEQAYFIPYHVYPDFNSTNDESCKLELGKAYEAHEFVQICENEAAALAKKADDEKKAEEAAKYAAEHPIKSIDEDGDDFISIAGVNFDEVKKEIFSAIENAAPDAKVVKISISNDEYCFLSEHTYKSSSSKTQLADFVDGLFDEIYLQATSGSVPQVDGEAYCAVNVWQRIDGKYKWHSTSMQISDNAIKIKTENHGEVSFNLKNGDAVLKYLADSSENAFSTFRTARYDADTPEIRGTLDGLTKTDVISFEYKLPSNADNSLAREVAQPGTTIKCTFEKYKVDKYEAKYLLTLSGNMGTLCLHQGVYFSLSGDQEYLSNNLPVQFSNRDRYENGNIVNYKIGMEANHYNLKMVFKNNDISEVYLNDVKCTDLEYTQITDDTKLSEQYVERDKQVILEQLKGEKEQNKELKDNSEENTDEKADAQPENKPAAMGAGECADTLYKFGLFKGTDKGYELEKSLTREESAAILVRLLGQEEKLNAGEYDEIFSDVQKDRWSYAYVMYCYKNNITKGTSSSTFSPDAQIDAQQFTALLLRLLGYIEVNPDTALDKGVEYKLLNAEMAEQLKKAEVFTRSEMVQIVYSSLKTQMNDDTVFSDYLSDKGILSQDEIEQIK